MRIKEMITKIIIPTKNSRNIQLLDSGENSYADKQIKLWWVQRYMVVSFYVFEAIVKCNISHLICWKTLDSDHKQMDVALSVSQCAVPVYLMWQMSWGSVDTCAVFLQYGCMCESSKILLWQNFCHSVCSDKGVHLQYAGTVTYEELAMSLEKKPQKFNNYCRVTSWEYDIKGVLSITVSLIWAVKYPPRQLPSAGRLSTETVSICNTFFKLQANTSNSTKCKETGTRKWH